MGATHRTPRGRRRVVSALVRAGSAALLGLSGGAATATEIGRSARGTPIVVRVHGKPDARVRVLVVGSVHGNETAGVSVARRLAHLRIPQGVAVWVVADLNPDGSDAGTRQNARGVDLNRNFPRAWRSLGPRGTPNYAGTGPSSEPETRAAVALIEEVRPTIALWFHQALDLVDLSGGSLVLQRRYAQLTGMRAERLSRYPGSATGWQNATHPGTTAFVVELPPGRLRAAAVDRHARAVLRLARGLAVAD